MMYPSNMCHEKTRPKKTRSDVLIFTYALIVALVALILFLYGFFPVKYENNDIARRKDVPDRVDHVRVNTDELYRKRAQKIIIMVIDALRWDFMTGPVGKSAMPITSQLISKNSTCLMQANSNPPTVTMPRIKAMMNGAASSFIDVALNFGDSPELANRDSVLMQAKKHGHKIHFYGDDTWLKIFPGMFERFEGTTSFFVNDFVEVDDNVTRHISKELEKKQDWSFLILHYLGLDHIGHVSGPFSPLIQPKLKEMDNIIGKIYGEIQHWKSENDSPAILVVCGDHGMKDSGGHGGSTKEETLVPFLVIGKSCSANIDKPNSVYQVDVAATLSMMLGTPIPSSNIGSVPLQMLDGLSDSEKLFTLYYNGQTILKHFEKLRNYEYTEAYKNYKNAIDLHVNWLTSAGKIHLVKQALALYKKAYDGMKESLIHSTIDYDLHSVTVAIIFMVQAIYIIANVEYYGNGQILTKLYWIIGSVISYFVLRFAWEPENGFSMSKIDNSVMNLIFFGILLLNSHFAGCISLLQSDLKNLVSQLTFLQSFLLLGTIAHIFSFASSSFIEEEHQTWYYFWTTLLVIMIVDSARKRCQVELIIQIFVALAAHRILRKLKSTGNKYADAPDISKWLRDQDGNLAVTIFLLAGLGLLTWIGYICEDNKHKVKSLIFHIGAAICVYLRHMSSKTVAVLPFYGNSKGVMEAQIFWFLIILYCIYWFQRLYRLKKKSFPRSFLRFIVQMWILISALLHRPQNVILLPAQISISYVIHETLRMYEGMEYASIFIYMWMGNVFYFYQGNSNSLATVDVAAGYVGMESYRPVITTLLLCIHTYSAPILAYLTLLYHSSLVEQTESFAERVLSINRNYALWRFLPTAVFAIIVTIQRFHLFVWTVFSPKLIYEAMHCAVMFSFIIATQTVCSYATR